MLLYGSYMKGLGLNWRRLFFLAYFILLWPKCSLAYPKQWVDISSILLLIHARSNVTINSIIMISVIHATKAKLNLGVINETIGVWLLFWFLLIHF
jgi:hypothetical protein